MQIIPIASDHAGFELKKTLIEHLNSNGYQALDLGAHSSESVDYPDFAHPLAREVESGKYPFGIAICGSGNGINMTVNKHSAVRAALCWNAEIAALARAHNNANILSLPARFVSTQEALAILRAFIDTPFEGGRHLNRINKIPIA